jgi:hypothetical protein
MGFLFSPGFLMTIPFPQDSGGPAFWSLTEKFSQKGQKKFSVKQG